MIKALPHIGRMSSYALADMTAAEGMETISLSQNESLRSPSPNVIRAATDALTQGSGYPDPDWTALRMALGDLHGIPSEKILCGAGSLDLIGCLLRSFAGPDCAILAPAHAYPFFKTAAQMADARFDTAPEVDETVSVDVLLKAVRSDTGVVCVANPGNPTGTRIPKSELQRLRAGLRADIILVIDEAYGEFADHLDARCWDMVESGNCIVLRTFSKAYSMAGYRIGWGVFPEAILSEVRKVMNPNNVTRASQAAALAALKDQGYMRETCKITADIREKARDALIQAGFDVAPSVTNFLLIRFEDAALAEAADTALRAQGIFLRQQRGAGLPHALRMTIGPVPATLTAIAGLIDWKKGTRS